MREILPAGDTIAYSETERVPYSKINKITLKENFDNFPSMEAISKILPQADVLQVLANASKEIMPTALEVAGEIVNFAEPEKSFEELLKNAKNRNQNLDNQMKSLEGDSFEKINGNTALQFLKNKM